MRFRSKKPFCVRLLNRLKWNFEMKLGRKHSAWLATSDSIIVL